MGSRTISNDEDDARRPRELRGSHWKFFWNCAHQELQETYEDIRRTCQTQVRQTRKYEPAQLPRCNIPDMSGLPVERFAPLQSKYALHKPQ